MARLNTTPPRCVLNPNPRPGHLCPAGGQRLRLGLNYR